MADPTTMTHFPFAGTFEYFAGSTVVPAPGEFPDPAPLDLKAVVYFPADQAGASDPSQISDRRDEYPMVVVVHGNSGSLLSYKGYNYLLEHLARNGMIAASIHVYPGAAGVSRAWALFKHIEILKTKFGSTIDLERLGIMGHSRGGEAVVIASKLNVDGALGYNFKAIISLAPTDQYGPYSLAGPYAVPYLVVYGGLDGDVAGGWPKSTGFSLYDRADPVKSMIFAERACHDRFNTQWDSNDFFFGQLTVADQGQVVNDDAHQKIAKGYMNAFFRWRLFDEDGMRKYFTGVEVPEQVEDADNGAVCVDVQYQEPHGLKMDEFSNNDWHTNDLGGAVTANLPSNPTEGDLVTLDSYSPHDHTGGELIWSASKHLYTSAVPVADQNLHPYRMLSFRVTQRYASGANTTGADQDFKIVLTDEDGRSHHVNVSDYATLDYPFLRGYSNLVKSSLKTVRIPLKAFKSETHAGKVVDLKEVVSITFDLGVKPTGDIEVTDIEFVPDAKEA
jgi:hypothetical protein